MTTVPMQHIDSGKKADVHPDEVANWKAVGWCELEAPKPFLPPPMPEEPSEAVMRKVIFEETGERPGPNTKRETLIEKYNAVKG